MRQATVCLDGERMGRESRFLLTLLGLLAGVFVAALSLRLFVPRPPRGTGPDIHTTTPMASTEIVPPPVLSPSPAATAPWAAPPDDVAPAPSRFVAPEEPSLSPWKTPAESEALPTEPLTILNSDETPALAAVPSPTFPDTAATYDKTGHSLPALPAATLVSNQIPATPQEVTPPQQQLAPLFREDTAAEANKSVREDAPTFSPSPVSPPAPAITPITPNQPYRVAEGDSWWDIADRAYGDGRFYRSLFAWNRAITPRITLAEGTVLEIPPPDRLKLAWPQLMPGN